MKKKVTKKVIKKAVSDKQKIKELTEALEQSKRMYSEYYDRWVELDGKTYDLRNALNCERQKTENLLLELGKKKLESAVAYGRLSVLMRVSNLYNRPEIETIDNLPFEREY